MKVLAGDIGGTKTLLRIAEVDGEHVELLHEQRFLSQEYELFDTLVTSFLRDAPALAKGMTRACFGVAGPVRRDGEHRVAQVTHLPWQLDNRKLSALIGIADVRLINDFEAIGFGVGGVAAADIVSLQAGHMQTNGVRLIVGAGTGLGVAHLVRGPGGTRVLPSQGGHVGFAPADELEDALLHYLRRRAERVSWEHVVSGPGLMQLYDFLYHHQAYHDDARYKGVINSADPSAAITTAAAAGDELCKHTLNLFVRLYGRVCGDLALVDLPFGGVYLAGGIAPKIIDALADSASGFLAAFQDKGPMTPLMSSFPVAVITDTHVGVIGAAIHAAQ